MVESSIMSGCGQGHEPQTIAQSSFGSSFMKCLVLYRALQVACSVTISNMR